MKSSERYPHVGGENAPAPGSVALAVEQVAPEGHFSAEQSNDLSVFLKGRPASGA